MEKVKKKHAPYSLYKKKVTGRIIWYVRFWDYERRIYAFHSATGVEAGGKKERRAEADAAARRMMPDVSLRAAGASLLDFVGAFWKEGSRYFREAELSRGSRLSPLYSAQARSLIRCHLSRFPPFSSIGADALTPAVLRDFMLWASERGLSPSRIGKALQVLRVPVRYAYGREELASDPFSRIAPPKPQRREKGALSKEELKRVIESPPADPERRFAFLLAALCGLRLGEARGLHWEDVDFGGGIVRVRRNYQSGEGLKEPKCGSARDVPLPAALAEPLREWKGRESGFVFDRGGKPPCIGFFRKAFTGELEGIGVPPAEQRARNLSFHSLRHTYVSLGRLAGLNGFQIQTLAGHKSSQMMDRYSHGSQTVEMEECRRALDGLLARREPCEKKAENAKFFLENA